MRANHSGRPGSEGQRLEDKDASCTVYSEQEAFSSFQQKHFSLHRDAEGQTPSQLESLRGKLKIKR